MLSYSVVHVVNRLQRVYKASVINDRRSASISDSAVYMKRSNSGSSSVWLVVAMAFTIRGLATRFERQKRA